MKDKFSSFYSNEMKIFIIIISSVSDCLRYCYLNTLIFSNLYTDYLSLHTTSTSNCNTMKQYEHYNQKQIASGGTFDIGVASFITTYELLQ